MENDNLEQLIREYQTLYQTNKDAEKRLDQLKGIFKAQMGQQDTKVLSGNGISIRWRPQELHRFDTKRFQQENPRMAKQYQTAVTYNYFDVMEGTPTGKAVEAKKRGFSFPWFRKP